MIVVRYSKALIRDQGASRGPGHALVDTYPPGHSVSGYRPYDGTLSRRLLLKWQSLSDSPARAANIPNLIWTDLAANMLVGTKSLTDSTRSYQVRMYKRKITYNYFFAIPAFCCWVLWIAWIVAIIMLSIVGSAKDVALSRCKDRINRLSVGRALVVAGYPSSNHFGTPTADWLKSAGGLEIDLTKVGSAEQQGQLLENADGNKMSSSTIGKAKAAEHTIEQGGEEDLNSSKPQREEQLDDQLAEIQEFQ